MDIYKLTEDGIIEAPFDYKDLDSDLYPHIILKYQYFENKFKKLYSCKLDRFKLENCFFYIKNDPSCNAFARHIDGYNIIGITNGYAIKMFEAFDEKYFTDLSILSLTLKNLDNKEVANGYSNLYNIHDFKINKFMLNCSTQFTFSHEFQHILQFNASEIIINDYRSENSDNLENSKFDITRHAKELDADWFAVWDVVTYILNIKNKYNFTYKKTIDKNSFVCLLFLGVGSLCITQILSYFGAWNLEKNIEKLEFYIKEKKHPHPLVRLFNIIDGFHNQIADSLPNLNIDKQVLLNNVLAITAAYFNSFTPKNKIIINMLQDMEIHLDTINNYNNELYDVMINDNTLRSLLIKRGINFKKD